MNTTIIPILLNKLEKMNVLKPSFELTIHEFTDKNVIRSIEAESRARGFNSCEAYEDDGTRAYYCDDPEFVKAIGMAAINDESNASVSQVQNLLSFLINGGLKPEMKVSEARVIGGGYSVHYYFPVAIWTAFNWDQAINGYAVDGESDGELIENVVRLFYEI